MDISEGTVSRWAPGRRKPPSQIWRAFPGKEAPERRPERYDPSPGYDLVVAINTLVYFNEQELRLALANIRSMLRPGGCLVHYEIRPEIDGLGPALGLVRVQARTIQLSAGASESLYDSSAIQRRI